MYYLPRNGQGHVFTSTVNITLIRQETIGKIIIVMTWDIYYTLLNAFV